MLKQTWPTALCFLLIACGDSDDSSGRDDGSGESPAGGTGTGGIDGSGATGSGATGAGGQATGSGGTPTDPCGKDSTYPEPDLSAAPTAVHSGSGSGLFEGVLWLDRGVLVFSDMDFSSEPVPSNILELTPPTSIRQFATDTGTNGLAQQADGTIIGCSHGIQGLIRLDPNTGASTTWVDGYQGNAFNSPNDLTIRADGTVYFTDPDWQLGPRQSETGVTGIYRVTPQGEVTLVDDSLTNPNGITLSPDQTTLYVGDESGTVWRYAVAADGSTSGRAAFVSGIGFPDGMGLDCAGNLYVADHHVGLVRVYTPSGSLLGTLNVESAATNIAFGGPNRTTLYVSANKTIYALEMNLPGYPY